MDRWNIVSTLNYLNEDLEFKIIASKTKDFLKYKKENLNL